MGKASRDKGRRRERAIVDLHVKCGIRAERVPLSGAVRTRQRCRCRSVCARRGAVKAEVKARAAGAGFRTLDRWLGDNDALFLWRDRVAPLVVLFPACLARSRSDEHAPRRYPTPTRTAASAVATPSTACCHSDRCDIARETARRVDPTSPRRSHAEQPTESADPRPINAAQVARLPASTTSPCCSTSSVTEGIDAKRLGDLLKCTRWTPLCRARSPLSAATRERTLAGVRCGKTAAASRSSQNWLSASNEPGRPRSMLLATIRGWGEDPPTTSLSHSASPRAASHGMAARSLQAVFAPARTVAHRSASYSTRAEVS